MCACVCVKENLLYSYCMFLNLCWIYRYFEYYNLLFNSFSQNHKWNFDYLVEQICQKWKCRAIICP